MKVLTIGYGNLAHACMAVETAYLQKGWASLGENAGSSQDNSSRKAGILQASPLGQHENSGNRIKGEEILPPPAL